MLAYPIVLEDDDGAVLATSPDFPELTTFGKNRTEAIAHAVRALEEAIAARIHDRREIPPPGSGEVCAVLPTLTSIKVVLYLSMREQDIGKAELARRLGWHMPQVDRALDIGHHSRLDQMDAALAAIGARLCVTTIAWPPVRSIRASGAWTGRLHVPDDLVGSDDEVTALMEQSAHDAAS